MLTIGLTGGIGSGKSEVARMFSQLGVPVIDADVIARELVLPGTAGLSEVVSQFGKAILTADGMLDRARLAEIVFHDPQKKKQLESIIHPRVREQINAFKHKYTDKPYILLVIPLLLETGQRDIVDRLLIVNAEDTVRIQRVQARDGRDQQQIHAIIQSQADDATRQAAADDSIDNNGSIDELQKSVQQLHQQYMLLADKDNFM